MKLKRIKPILSLTVASALTLGAFATPFSSTVVDAESNTIKVQLLGMNDLHGQIDYTLKQDRDGDGERETFLGGMDYAATYLKEREASNPNTLIVHSGDMVGGSPLVSSYFQDEPTIEIMEAMGFDVGTVGNHEFDEGIAEMLRLVNGGEHPEGKGTAGFDGTNFPMVAANVYDKSTGKLLLDPYTVQVVGGTKIGFIGVATQETPTMIISKGNENLQITDEAEAINKYVKELKDQGVRAIVVLAHNPTTNENNNAAFDASLIAEKLDAEVDVLFAGHNHRAVNKMVKNVLIVQAYSYSTAFSDVDLEIDPSTGDVVKKTAVIVDVNQAGITPDATVKAIIDKYSALVEEVKNEVIAETSTDFAKEGYAKRGLVGDSPIGNLIADGMRHAMDTDFALMNGGGIRSEINKGEITFGDLFTVQPFGNVLNKVDVTGADLYDIMNAQIDPVRGLDYQISGFSYTWNGDTNTIVDIFLPDGSKIDLDGTYSLVVNNYMYGKTDSRIAELGENLEVGPEDLQATVDYVKSLGSPFTYKADGRISEVRTPFTDLSEGHWAYDYVTELRFDRVINGTTASTFSPNAQVTRAQFASLLARSLNLKAEGEPTFTDVSDVRADIQTEIAAAFESGIVKGKTTTTFSPNAPITRAEMVTMLMRAYNFKNKTEYASTGTSTFTDITNLDTEMKAAVVAAFELELISGFSKTQFKPAETANRAQAAKVIYTLLNN